MMLDKKIKRTIYYIMKRIFLVELPPHIAQRALNTRMSYNEK